MADTIMIQLTYTEETDFGTFIDSIYFTPEEYDIVSKEEITKQKKIRLDSWIAHHEYPNQVVPTVEDCKYIIDSLLNELSIYRELLKDVATETELNLIKDKLTTQVNIVQTNITAKQPK
jgi:hypothetical protein